MNAIHSGLGKGIRAKCGQNRKGHKVTWNGWGWLSECFHLLHSSHSMLLDTHGESRRQQWLTLVKYYIRNSKTEERSISFFFHFCNWQRTETTGSRSLRVHQDQKLWRLVVMCFSVCITCNRLATVILCTLFWNQITQWLVVLLTFYNGFSKIRNGSLAWDLSTVFMLSLAHLSVYLHIYSICIVYMSHNRE